MKEEQDIIENGIEYYVVYFSNTKRTCYYLGEGYHRELGPAVIYDDGRMEWYWDDKKIPVNSQEEFEKYLKLKAFW